MQAGLIKFGAAAVIVGLAGCVQVSRGALSLPGSQPVGSTQAQAGTDIRTVGPARGVQALPGGYIVQVRKGENPASVAADHGVTPTIVYRHAINGFAGAVPAGRLAALRRDARVLIAEPDHQVFKLGKPAKPTPAPTATPVPVAQVLPAGIQRAQGHLGATAQAALWGTTQVAVIDTGVDLDHPDIRVAADSQTCIGKNFWGATCKVGGDDVDGHGSHVAGTIGAMNNDRGVVGMAPGVEILAMRVFKDASTAYTSWIIAAIDWLMVNKIPDRVRAINMSLGLGSVNTSLDTAITNAVADGAIFVVAAGNDAVDAGLSSPGSAAGATVVAALADNNGAPGGGATFARKYPDCLDASSMETDDTTATFSNFGPVVDVAAPGVNIYSTYLAGGYACLSGTSMAAPHVAGAAALFALNHGTLAGADLATAFDARLRSGYPTEASTSAIALQKAVLEDANLDGTPDGGYSGSVGDWNLLWSPNL